MPDLPPDLLAPTALPPARLTRANAAPLRPERAYVLRWVTAARRVRHSFGWDRAVELARALGKPLVVLEGLRVGYRYASVRHHRFVLEGMRDTAARLARTGVTYLPYVERREGDGKGLLAALSADACAVVGDDWPCFFHPRMVRAAGAALDAQGTPLELVDGNGLYPMRATERVFTVAHSFRRHLQKALGAHLDPGGRPTEDPLAAGAALPGAPGLGDLAARWRMATAAELADPGGLCASLPIDQRVGPGIFEGGAVAGEARMRAFLDARLARYGDDRNEPGKEGASGLSPYLHFGHVGAHHVFAELIAREGWTPADVAPKANGKRHGWWGMSEAAEGFLDELVTWREVGHNYAAVGREEDLEAFDSLPPWALATLADHAADPREHVYGLEALERAETHDPLWNAAQRQLTREGRMHNYLRMLWGKKILEWSAHPREALAVMLELNHKYALDGRDPNSASGVLWVLGRYDRAWGPERPIFGKVRFMSSANTARKVDVKSYLRRYA